MRVLLQQDTGQGCGVGYRCRNHERSGFDNFQCGRQLGKRKEKLPKFILRETVQCELRGVDAIDRSA